MLQATAFCLHEAANTETGIQAISAILKPFFSRSLSEWSQTSSAETPLPRKPLQHSLSADSSFAWHRLPSVVEKLNRCFGQELSFYCVTTSRAEMNSFLPLRQRRTVACVCACVCVWGGGGGGGGHEWHTQCPYLEPSHLCPPHRAQFLLQVGAHPPWLRPSRRQAYFSVEEQSTKKYSLPLSQLLWLVHTLLCTREKVSSLDAEPKVENGKKATPNHISCFSLSLRHECLDFDLTLDYFADSVYLDNSLTGPANFWPACIPSNLHPVTSFWNPPTATPTKPVARPSAGQQVYSVKQTVIKSLSALEGLHKSFFSSHMWKRCHQR